MNRGETQGGTTDRPAPLPAWQHGAIFLIACLVLISRRPEAMFHAQFYAEDGHVWFADAYNLGWWSALFRPQDGYFQTFSRLGGALALLLPMARAPLVLNAIALCAQALPVNLLMSARSAGWGSLRFRALLSTAYLVLPDCGETGFGITESQWLLALNVFLLLVAIAPRGLAGRIFDWTLILLSGLSGPFCIFLLPIAGFVALRRGERGRWTPAGLLAACALIQAYSLLVIDRYGRAHFPLGASPELFVRILSGNVFLGAVLGYTRLGYAPGTGVLIFLVCVAVAGSAIAASCFLGANVEMRLFMAFSGMLYVASLLFPVVRPPQGYTVWDVLEETRGAHYWFIPSLAFAWSLVWIMQQARPAAKALSILFLFAMGLGIVQNWELPPFQDFHYADFARSFESAPAGTVMTIPENPNGWSLKLIKHAVTF
jgi:hypothetical protein